MKRNRPDAPRDYLARYPRLCAHIIAESLGYATPSVASQILRDAKGGRLNYCEWVYSCYRGNPREAVEQAVRHRHHHVGYMASYQQARAIVRRELETGEGPLFASWF
jgi:hypothetical protein